MLGKKGAGAGHKQTDVLNTIPANVVIRTGIKCTVPGREPEPRSSAIGKRTFSQTRARTPTAVPQDHKHEHTYRTGRRVRTPTPTTQTHTISTNHRVLSGGRGRAATPQAIETKRVLSQSCNGEPPQQKNYKMMDRFRQSTHVHNPGRNVVSDPHMDAKNAMVDAKSKNSSILQSQRFAGTSQQRRRNPPEGTLAGVLFPISPSPKNNYYKLVPPYKTDDN